MNRRFGKRCARLLIPAALLAALLSSAAFAQEDGIRKIISGMTLHEKVCQLFIVQPEQFSRMDSVKAPSAKLRRAFKRFPVGGVALFNANMQKRSLAQLNEAMQGYALESSGIGLLIGTDEEGGGVSRVANRLKLGQAQPSASEIGKSGDPMQAYRAASAIGEYLAGYGFNLDFAPVADVRYDVKNAEITRRSFGDDPQTVADMTAHFVRGLGEKKIISVLKHFPGHGSVSGNTHTGIGTTEKTVDDWRTSDFLPFRAGIDAGAGMVMISHMTAVKADPDHPASLSPVIIGYLRGELGYDGVVVTDALRMDAVHARYSSGEACVLAIEAGADMLLLPYNFTNAYNGVMKALNDRRLTEERIDESLYRILTLKKTYGLLEITP